MMGTKRRDSNDSNGPLGLAEDVAAGRLTMMAAEARIRGANANPEAAQRTIDEFRSLLRGLAAVGMHSTAWRDDQAGVAAGTRSPGASTAEPAAATLNPLAGRIAPRRRGGIRVVVGGLASIAAIVVVAIVVASLRLAPAGSRPGGPGSVGSGGSIGSGGSQVAGSPGIASPTTGPTSTAPAPEPTPASSAPPVVPSPTGAAGLPPILSQPLPNAGSLAFWSVGVVPGKLTLWRWNPAEGGAFVDVVDVPVWTATATTYQVLASPDGLRFAVVEHLPGDPATHDRVRVFNIGGYAQWTSPDGMPRTTDMAWSADGNRLALGSVPNPWTIISFGDASNSVATRTYNVSVDAAYRLLGFSADGMSLYGYETSGEAEFWQKPVRLDLLGDGLVQTLDAFPSGASALAESNATGPTDQIAPGTGAVVALTGTAKGTPEWIVRTGTAEQSLAVDPSASLIWAGPQTLAELMNDSGGNSGSGFALALAPVPPASGGVSPTLNLGGGTTGGTEFASLAGSRGSYVLVVLATAQPASGVTGAGVEAVLVDAASGQVGVGLLPTGVPTGTEFGFAGWMP